MSDTEENEAPLNAPDTTEAAPSSPIASEQATATTTAATTSNVFADSGYSSFFQADAATLLRTLNELERKLRDAHTAPQWLNVVFAKLKKLDELEESVHKLQLTTPVDTLDELFRNQQVERYTNMLKDEYLSKEGTVASELYARVQALELEQNRLQKLLAARPTVTDMQVLKNLHAEHFRSLQRQYEDSHSGLQAQLQGLFAAELEEFHKWRQSQESMLHAKLATVQTDMGSLTSARDVQRTEIESIRLHTTQTLEKVQADVVTSRDELSERMAAAERMIEDAVAQSAATSNEVKLQKKEMERVTQSIEERLGDLEAKAAELLELIHGVQSKAREDVLDVKKIAQVSRANMLELVARQDTIEESIVQAKQELRQEDGKLLELIGGLTMEVRSANENHVEARSQLEHKLEAQLTATREKVGELAMQVTAMSQDVGNMLMSVGGMPGQIHALELHMRQVTEEVTDSLARLERSEGTVSDHDAKLVKLAESLEDLRDSCFQLKEANVQIDLALEDSTKKAAALQARVNEEQERMHHQFATLEGSVDTLSSSVNEFQAAVTDRHRRDQEQVQAQLMKLGQDVDKLRRTVDDMPTSSALSSKKSIAGKLKAITAAAASNKPLSSHGADATTAKVPEQLSSRRSASASSSPRPISGNPSKLQPSPPASRGKPNAVGLPAIAPANSNEPSAVHKLEALSAAGSGQLVLTSVEYEVANSYNGSEAGESESVEDEPVDEHDPIHDAVQFFGDLCVSFEEIAVKKTAVPELNSALCDQITAVAQETSNHFASTADAEIISRVLRAKASEVTYDDMVSERRIALLSEFQNRIDKYVQQASPSGAGIIRLEARELFLRKVRAALDIAMSKHEQVLVTAHSRLGRVAIPTCIACDRPLLNRHRHLQHRSVYGNDFEYQNLAEGSVSSLSKLDDESTLPIPTKESWKTAPSQAVQIAQSRPHTSVMEQRYVKRGSGFKMTRPATRSLDTLHSPASRRSPTFPT